MLITDVLRNSFWETNDGVLAEGGSVGGGKSRGTIWNGPMKLKEWSMKYLINTGQTLFKESKKFHHIWTAFLYKGLVFADISNHSLFSFGHAQLSFSCSKQVEKGETRGVDDNKRTVTTHSCSFLLGLRFDHLMSSCLFYWPHLGQYQDLPQLSACFELSRYVSLVSN